MAGREGRAGRSALVLAVTRFFHPRADLAVAADDLDADDHVVVALARHRLTDAGGRGAVEEVARERQLLPAPARRGARQARAAEEERSAGVQLGRGVVAPESARLPALRMFERLLVILRHAEEELAQLPAAEQRPLDDAPGCVRAGLDP